MRATTQAHYWNIVSFYFQSMLVAYDKQITLAIARDFWKRAKLLATY